MGVWFIEFMSYDDEMMFDEKSVDESVHFGMAMAFIGMH